MSLWTIEVWRCPVEDRAIARPGFGATYRVRGRAEQYEFILNAVEASGGRVIYASASNRAPLFVGVQMDSDERLGLLVYPFTMTRRVTKNRPADEFRVQLRYGSEESWGGEHPIGRDIAGVDVTMILGVDHEAGVFVGLDATLWDPLPMGISFSAKDAEVNEAKSSGWHVWERDNRGGKRRAASRSPTNLETVVGFTPDRLLDYARLERRATSLRLDPALRYAAATAMAAPSVPSEQPGRHVLEEQFALTSEQILDIIGGRNRLAVAVRGGVAEYHLERQLRSAPGIVRVERLDIDAKHDFDVVRSDGTRLRVECKNASPRPYANGDFRVEVQKTRASQNDPASRYYPIAGFDVVAACLFSATGRWEFRFGATSRMARHAQFSDRLAPVQTITEDWVTHLSGLSV